MTKLTDYRMPWFPVLYWFRGLARNWAIVLFVLLVTADVMASHFVLWLFIHSME